MGRVLITGCNGYLGTEMGWYFKIHGWEVFGLDPKPAPKFQEDILLDFENKIVQDLKSRPWAVDAVIHLGGFGIMADDFEESNYQEHNVNSTKVLRELYPDVPLYLASTMSMYNEDKQIEHVHPYSRSKHEAENYVDVAFRMGAITGTNRDGSFNGVVDAMIDSAIRKNEIIIAQGTKMRAPAGLTYICMMYYRNVANGLLANRSRKESAQVVMHLYETCQSIEDIAMAVHQCMGILPKYNTEKINFTRQDDLKGIINLSAYISHVPPDFQPSHVYDVRLNRIVMECIERYECFVKGAKS